jgi:hypothetical protein
MSKTFIITCVLASITPAAQQIHVDYMRPPAALSSLFTESEAVALVRIVGHAEVFADASRTRTDYSVLVLEKFKGDGSTPAKGPGLVVRRSGGLTPNNAEVGFPQFQPGEQYILFLKYSHDLGGWTPAYGPEGAIKVDTNGRLAPIGYQVARQYKDQLAGSLLSELRRLASESHAP